VREEFALHQNNAFLICFGKLGTPKLRRTAMLCTQHPQELGLPGYPVQELTCTFQVREDDGTEKSIFVDDILFNSALANLSHKMSLAIWLTFLPTCARLSSSFPLYLDGDLKHAMPEQPENERARPGHQFE
jgi:hypothetical protein